MVHPLEFVSHSNRRTVFLTLLGGTLILFAVFSFLDGPLRTKAAPGGILSFEMAGTPARAQAIVDSWHESNGETSPVLSFGLFGLGLDYLFMPMYAGALCMALLLLTSKRGGWLKGMGALLSWGILAGALLDGVENYALARMLLMNQVVSPLPEIAAACAKVKFGILLLGLIYIPLAKFWPLRTY